MSLPSVQRRISVKQHSGGDENKSKLPISPDEKGNSSVLRAISGRPANLHHAQNEKQTTRLYKRKYIYIHVGYI